MTLILLSDLKRNIVLINNPELRLLICGNKKIRQYSSNINMNNRKDVLLIPERPNTNGLFLTYFEYDPDLLDFTRGKGYLVSFNGNILVRFPAREYFRRLLHLFFISETFTPELYRKYRLIVDELYIKYDLNFIKTAFDNLEDIFHPEPSKCVSMKYEAYVKKFLNKNPELSIDIAIESRQFGLNLATRIFQEFIEKYYFPTFEDKLIRVDYAVPVLDYNYLKSKGFVVEDEFEFTTLDLGKFFVYKEQVILFMAQLIEQIAYFGDETREEIVSEYLEEDIIFALQPYLEIFLTNLRNLANDLPSIGLSFNQTVKFYISTHKKVLKSITIFTLSTLLRKFIINLFPGLSLIMTLLNTKSLKIKEIIKYIVWIIIGIIGFKYIQYLISGYNTLREEYEKNIFIKFVFPGGKPEMVVKTGYDFCKVFNKKATSADMIKLANRLIKYYHKHPHSTHEITSSFNIVIGEISKSKKNQKEFKVFGMKTLAMVISHFHIYDKKSNKKDIYNYSLNDPDQKNIVSFSETIGNMFYLERKLQIKFNDPDLKLKRPIIKQSGDAIVTIFGKEYYYDNKRIGFKENRIENSYDKTLETKNLGIKENLHLVVNVTNQSEAKIKKIETFCRNNNIKIEFVSPNDNLEFKENINGIVLPEEPELEYLKYQKSIDKQLDDINNNMSEGQIVTVFKKINTDLFEDKFHIPDVTNDVD